MNTNQRRIFHEFADGLSNRSDTSYTLNDAIVAAAQELELLGLQRDELLSACKALATDSSAAGLSVSDNGAWICAYCNEPTIYASSDLKHHRGCAILAARAAIARATGNEEESI